MPGAERRVRTQLADLLRDHAAEIGERWLSLVNAQVPGEVDLTELRDAMPDYLSGMELSLRGDAPPADDGRQLWVRVAQKHAVTRVRLGFDIDQLVREFVILRRVIFEMAREKERKDEQLFELITELIEAAIAVSVRSYVRSRDFLSQRAEAEHIAFVTHELRNPLTTATMAASQLRHADEKARSQIIDRLERSHLRLLELINGVLDVERLGAGQVEANPTEVALASLVEEATQSSREIAASKGLRLTADCPREIRIEIDPKLTFSALHNLVENAVKYTPKGAVSVSVEEDVEEIRIHVYDSCGGLSDTEMRVLFEPFRRGPHRDAPGTGLGLAIAHRALDAQGGRLEVESTGGGCHFWMTLPRRPDLSRKEEVHGGAHSGRG